MKDTACGQDCPFVKNGLCKTDRECCNYVESWWTNSQTNENTLVKDCAPKRILLQQHQEVNYMLSLQQNVDELRKEVNALSSLLRNLIQQTHVYLQESAEQNLITHKD